MDPYTPHLRLSLEQYQKLFDLTEQIGNDVHKLDTASIRKYLDELNIQLTEAKETDKIISKFDVNSLPAETSTMLEERYLLMKNFLQLNNEVASMIRAKNAVLKSEYLKIKQGRTGLKGYQNSLYSSENRIINSSV